MKDAVATMGTILPDDVGGRDAVHVAVISVAAGEKLSAGQDVGIVDTIAKAAAKHLGIVDPFLKVPVLPGQRFWLYLYPRTITGLRHQWTHPDFPDASEGQVYARPSEKLASEQWIKNYADQLGVDYTALMEGAETWIGSNGWGEYFYGDSDDDGMRGTLEGIATEDEFWTHYERVRGVAVPDGKRKNFFACSC